MWRKVRIGLVTVCLAAIPMLVSAETESGEAEPIAPTVTVAPSGWAKPSVQFGGYAAYAALQALDIVSTMKALKTPGAYEANPMYAGVVDSPAKFIALKSASTAATILFMQRFSKKHPKASVFVMAGLNSGYLYVVNNNFKRANGH